jgi:hypothetical protein
VKPVVKLIWHIIHSWVFCGPQLEIVSNFAWETEDIFDIVIMSFNIMIRNVLRLFTMCISYGSLLDCKRVLIDKGHKARIDSQDWELYLLRVLKYEWTATTSEILSYALSLCVHIAYQIRDKKHLIKWECQSVSSVKIIKLFLGLLWEFYFRSIPCVNAHLVRGTSHTQVGGGGGF